MNPALRSASRGIPVLLAAGLVVLAVVKAEPASWLVGALGVALLVRTVPDLVRPGLGRERMITVAYLGVVAAGLLVYLLQT